MDKYSVFIPDSLGLWVLDDLGAWLPEASKFLSAGGHPRGHIHSVPTILC